MYRPLDVHKDYHVQKILQTREPAVHGASVEICRHTLSPNHHKRSAQEEHLEKQRSVLCTGQGPEFALTDIFRQLSDPLVCFDNLLAVDEFLDRNLRLNTFSKTF